MEAVELSAITLNCWGIAGVSKDRCQRMEAIAEHLSSGKYDFVFLQEIWVEDDYKIIAHKIASVLPYSHYFHSGVIGGGICIFSKGKIIDTFFHGWSLNGYIHKIQHGDWFGGKGVGVCTVEYQNLRFNLYVTHLHAEYNRENDEYYAHRITQAFETSQMIRLTRKTADVSILGGDLNTEPGDLPYKIIRHNASLSDLYLSTGKSEAEGTTSETPINSYTDVSSLRKCPNGKRIDYIMCSSRKELTVEAIDVYSPLPSRVEGQSYSYSDHEAVCARFQISECSRENNSEHVLKQKECLETLQESLEACESAMKILAMDKRKYLITFGVLVGILISLPFSNETSYILHYILVTCHLLLVLISTFCLLMATVWNRIEKHGILAGQLGITTRLKFISNPVS